MRSLIVDLRESLRGIPAAAWILFGGTFINRFGSFVVVFLVLYLTRQGYGPAQAGIAMGAYGGGSLIASWLGGHLADRLGRRNGIMVSMFSAAVFLILLSQARGLFWITVASAACGLSAELYRPASSALLADLTPRGKRVTAYALNRLAINLGFAFGPMAGGFLAERSFLILFLADAATCVIFGVVARTLLPHGFRSDGRSPDGAMRGGSVFADPAFVLVLIASVAMSIVFFQFESTFPLHVLASGHSSATYGVLISINGILIVALELLIATFAARFVPRRVIALGYLLTGMGFLFGGMVSSVPALAVGVVIWTLGEIVSTPVAAAWVADLAPDHMRGRYMGAWGSTWAIGMIVGPMVGTFVFDWRPAMVWYFCGALGVVASVLMLATRTGARAAATEAGQS